MFRSLILGTLAGILLCTPLAMGATKTDECAQAGNYSAAVVKARDLGMPPSMPMSLLDESARKLHHPAEKQANAFMRSIVVFAYKYSALDAAWIRQQVELACFANAPL